MSATIKDTRKANEPSEFAGSNCCELFDSDWKRAGGYEWRKRINKHGVPLTSIRFPGYKITWCCDCDPQEIFMSMKYEDYPEWDNEENEWMNASGGDPDPVEEAFRNELLAVMWRWSQESDLTMEQWLRVSHEAIQRIICR